MGQPDGDVGCPVDRGGEEVVKGRSLSRQEGVDNLLRRSGHMMKRIHNPGLELLSLSELAKSHSFIQISLLLLFHFSFTSTFSNSPPNNFSQLFPFLHSLIFPLELPFFLTVRSDCLRQLGFQIWIGEISGKI